jgi:aconitate hydratase
MRRERYATRGRTADRYRRQGVRVGLIARLGGQGPMLLGVRAVLAESYERIHRSNLVGMGILPLQFKVGETAATLGLTGQEVFGVEGVDTLLADSLADHREVTVKAAAENGSVKAFTAIARIDTPQEAHYYRHGGILPYVLRQMV